MAIEKKMARSFVPSTVTNDERYISRVPNSYEYEFNTFDGETEKSVTYPYGDVQEFVFDEEMHRLTDELEDILDKLQWIELEDLIAVKHCINTLKKNHEN